MKRIIEFQVLDEKYLFKENSVGIFEIDKTTRQLDVKSFYEAFFADKKDYSEIEFQNSSELNKDDEAKLRITELERENAELRKANDILKDALGFFAKDRKK